MPILEGVVGSSRLLMLDGVPYQREMQWVIDSPCEEEMETESEEEDCDSEGESDSHSSPSRRRTQPPSPVAVTSQKKKRRQTTKLSSGRKKPNGKTEEGTHAEQQASPSATGCGRAHGEDGEATANNNVCAVVECDPARRNQFFESSPKYKRNLGLDWAAMLQVLFSSIVRNGNPRDRGKGEL